MDPLVWQDFDSQGISEHLQIPLCSVCRPIDRQECCSMLTWQSSAGEPGTTVKKLEAQLPLIFQRDNEWNRPMEPSPFR